MYYTIIIQNVSICAVQKIKIHSFIHKNVDKNLHTHVDNILSVFPLS
jgi:hypothetical protein